MFVFNIVVGIFNFIQFAEMLNKNKLIWTTMNDS